MNIKLICFDLDGTLCAIKDIHFKALNQALKEVSDISISKEQHLNLYDGLSTSKKLELLTKNKNLPNILHEVIKSRKQEITLDMLYLFEFKPKFKNLFKTLIKKGYKLAICSNAVYSTVDLVIDKLEIKGYIDLVLSNEDVKNQKPNPEIYINACRFFNVNPSNVVIVEDGKYGIEAGKSAGCNVIEVKSPKEVHRKLLKFLNEKN